MSTTTPTAYLHYTNADDANRIVATLTLELSRSVEDTVYAVAVGGGLVPEVQHTDKGERDVAVLFTATEAPDTLYVEEVIWHRDTPLALTDATVITATEADALLDNSAGLPD